MIDSPKVRQLEETLRRKELELAMANECLAQFSYGISHEINSPANTLKSLLDLLREDLRHQLDPDTTELLDKISMSSSRLCDSISGVLAFSGSSRPSATRESVDCNLLINEVLKELAPAIDLRSARIVVEQLPVIRSSAKCLIQLFHHLIDNALKFTQKDDDSPLIHISAQRASKGYEFVISDQGQGVKAEHRENIFNVFERLNSQAQHRGAGIGLALCRQIVTSLGGQIWMEPELHQGAAFHVYLDD